MGAYGGGGMPYGAPVDPYGLGGMAGAAAYSPYGHMDPYGQAGPPLAYGLPQGMPQGMPQGLPQANGQGQLPGVCLFVYHIPNNAAEDSLVALFSPCEKINLSTIWTEHGPS